MGSDPEPGSAPRTIDDVSGWFFWIDRLMFDRLLEAQAGSEPGHLGCFLGKSAIAVGAHQRDGERFVVIDLLERTDLLDADDDQNRGESARFYSTLTKRAFERNYAALRGAFPEVVVGMSTTVVDHLPAVSVPLHAH